MKEYCGNCIICGKQHFRGDDTSHLLWYYHIDIGLMCRNHNGVDKLYQSLIDAANLELNEIEWEKESDKIEWEKERDN